jgi:hypothetical protein
LRDILKRWSMLDCQLSQIDRRHAPDIASTREVRKSRARHV